MSTHSEADIERRILAYGVESGQIAPPVDQTSQALQEGSEPELVTTPSLNEDGNEPDGREGAEEERKRERTFGGLSPQEAGKRSGEARRRQGRAREAEVEKASNGKTVIVRTPIEVGAIMAGLAIDAKKGSTQAARELREWMREYPADDVTDMSALDARTRSEVMSRVLAEIEQEEGQVPDAPLPA